MEVQCVWSYYVLDEYNYICVVAMIVAFGLQTFHPIRPPTFRYSVYKIICFQLFCDLGHACSKNHPGPLLHTRNEQESLVNIVIISKVQFYCNILSEESVQLIVLIQWLIIILLYIAVAIFNMNFLGMSSRFSGMVKWVDHCARLMTHFFLMDCLMLMLSNHKRLCAHTQIKQSTYIRMGDSKTPCGFHNFACSDYYPFVHYHIVRQN